MALVDDPDFEPINHFAEDLAKYRTTAAKALKNFELAYNDIMGFDNNDNVTTNSLSFENLSPGPSSPLSLDTNSHNEDEEFFNRTEPKPSEFSFPSYFTTYKPNVCLRCHKYMTPSKSNFYVPPYAQNFQTKQRCKKCSQFENKYSTMTLDDEVAIEHPLSTPKVKNTSEPNSSGEDSHKCPLKITIPEPFQMTIRDEEQKPIQELKKKQLKEKLNEETLKELCVQIYSNPAPGHIYVPLYQKMTEMNNNKKEQRKIKSAERAKEIMKPFHFPEVQRNKLRKSDSMPELQSEEEEEGSHAFKANPVPKNILKPDISERLKYKEITRQLRIAQRAQEMLKQSALPFSTPRKLNKSISSTNLSPDEYSNRQKLRKKMYRKTSGSMPRNQNAMKDWDSKVTKLVCTRKHAKEETEKKEEKDMEARYRDFLHAKQETLFNGTVRTTTTYILREREKRQELEARNKDSVNAGRKTWKKDLRDQLQTKLQNTTAVNFEKDIEEKLQNYRASRRMRQIEYEQELMDIQKRIEKQPLLIDRVSKVTKEDKSTNTEPKDFVQQSNTASNRTLSSASSLASHEDAKKSSHSSLSDDSEHSL